MKKGPHYGVITHPSLKIFNAESELLLMGHELFTVEAIIWIMGWRNEYIYSV